MKMIDPCWSHDFCVVIKMPNSKLNSRNRNTGPLTTKCVHGSSTLCVLSWIIPIVNRESHMLINIHNSKILTHPDNSFSLASITHVVTQWEVIVLE